MEKLIIEIMLIGVGLLFLFNNKNISRKVFIFYRKLYTENYFKIILIIFGALFIFTGLILMFLK